MSTTAIATRLPAPKTPKTVFKEMTPPLQAICVKMAERIGKVNSLGVLVYYDMGAFVKEVLETVESGDLAYGEKPIEQMAIYFDHQPNTLYGARQLATVFTRDFIKNKTEEAAKNNFTLSYNHWLQLSRVPSQQRRTELLNNCIKNRWSHAMLGNQAEASGDQAAHHRAGGRPPSVPKEAIPALIKLRKMAAMFTNYGNEAEETINNGLLDIPPDAINATVSTGLDETIQTLDEVNSTTNTYLSVLKDIRTKMAKATKTYKTDEKPANKKKQKAKAGR